MAALASLVGVVILRGAALQVLWQWFVVETFDVTALTLPQAIGLSLIVSLLTYQYIRDDEVSVGEQITREILTGLFQVSFTCLVGAIVYLFT